MSYKDIRKLNKEQLAQYISELERIAGKVKEEFDARPDEDREVYAISVTLYPELDGVQALTSGYVLFANAGDAYDKAPEYLPHLDADTARYQVERIYMHKDWKFAND